MSYASEEDLKAMLLREPSVAYGAQTVPGLDFSNGGSQGDKEVIEVLRQGFTIKSVQQVASWMGLTLEEMAQLLHISIRTLQRKSNKESLGALVSERLLDLGRVLAFGVQTLDDLPPFQVWLRSPLPAIDGATPLSYLDTAVGCQMIIDILGRLAHGVHS